MALGIRITIFPLNFFRFYRKWRRWLLATWTMHWATMKISKQRNHRNLSIFVNTICSFFILTHGFFSSHFFSISDWFEKKHGIITLGFLNIDKDWKKRGHTKKEKRKVGQGIFFDFWKTNITFYKLYNNFTGFSRFLLKKLGRWRRPKKWEKK